MEGQASMQSHMRIFGKTARKRSSQMAFRGLRITFPRPKREVVDNLSRCYSNNNGTDPELSFGARSTTGAAYMQACGTAVTTPFLTPIPRHNLSDQMTEASPTQGRMHERPIGTKDPFPAYQSRHSDAGLAAIPILNHQIKVEEANNEA